MTRHLDRARGILILILILSCFILYAGYLIKKEATILELYREVILIIDQETDTKSILNSAKELKLIEFIEILDVTNDLMWVDEKEIVGEINVQIGMQGQNKGLSNWLYEQKNDSISGIDASKLPSEYFYLFENDKRTLIIRRLATQMRNIYDALKGTIGPSGSVLDYHNAVDPIMKLHSLNISLSASNSLLVLAISSGVLSLYLLSLLGAIAYQIKYLEKREGTDLILFHPGRLSLTLSFLWMFFPIIATLYSYFSIGNIPETLLLCTIVVAVVTFITYNKTIKCRRLLFEKLATL